MSKGAQDEMGSKVADTVYVAAQEPPFERDPQPERDSDYRAWTLALDAGRSSGTMTLRFNGGVSSAIAFDASVDDVQSAVRTLPGLESADVVETTASTSFDIYVPYDETLPDILEIAAEDFGGTNTITRIQTPATKTVTRVTIPIDLDAEQLTSKAFTVGGKTDSTSAMAVRFNVDNDGVCGCYCCAPDHIVDVAITGEDTPATVRSTLKASLDAVPHLTQASIDGLDIVFTAPLAGAGNPLLPSADGVDNGGNLSGLTITASTTGEDTIPL